MAEVAPQVQLDAVDEDAVSFDLPQKWLHHCSLYALRGSGTEVVGHRLKVGRWADGVPSWAVQDSVLAKLSRKPLSNVLRVHGWAKDGESEVTALVVTDVPPGETLSSVLDRGVQQQHLASHLLTLSLLSAIVGGLDHMWHLGMTVGSLDSNAVFVKHQSSTASDGRSDEASCPPTAVVVDPLFCIICSTSSNVIPTPDPRYQAPELLSNEATNPTIASDLYAFGVLAWVVIHHPIQPAWFLKPEGPRKRLLVDPLLVPSTVLSDAVEACTEPAPASRPTSSTLVTSIPNLSSLSAPRDRCLNSNCVEQMRLIGQGAFGRVYLGGFDGFKVAIKVVGQGTARVDAFRELGFTTSVSHPNIAEVYGWVEKGPELWLVMKHYPQGNLEDWLRARYEVKQLRPLPPSEGGPFGWDVFFNVSIGIARALAYLGERNLLHRDVKPSNILMESLQDQAVRLDVPVLADFGLGRRLLGKEPEFTSRQVGTKHYAAPEISFARGQYPLTPKVDVFSLGAVMKQLLLWRPRTVGPPPVWGPPAAPVNQLVDSCLQRDPRNRPTARKLLDDLGSLRLAAGNVAPALNGVALV